VPAGHKRVYRRQTWRVARGAWVGTSVGFVAAAGPPARRDKQKKAGPILEMSKASALSRLFYARPHIPGRGLPSKGKQSPAQISGVNSLGYLFGTTAAAGARPVESENRAPLQYQAANPTTKGDTVAGPDSQEATASATWKSTSHNK